MRSGWQRCAMWGLLLLVSHPAWGLDPQRSLDHYGRQSWSTDTGLPQNTVHAIVQTRDGYLWLGTEGGLVRFDGMQFVTFSRENTPLLPSDIVYDLLEDSSGALWISTAAGVVRYRSGAFEAFSGLHPGPVWFCYEDRQQRLWASTATGPAVLEDTRFVALAGAQAASPTSRQAIAEDTQGTIWLGSQNGLLAIKGKTVVQHLLQGEQVETLLADPGGGLPGSRLPGNGIWIGTNEGLTRYAGGALTPSARGEVAALAWGADGSLWAGTAAGLIHLPQHGGAVTLAAERVEHLMRDRQGVLWVGAERGVFRVIENQLQSFAPGTALTAEHILALFEDREGDLWIGAESGGLHMLRDQKFTTYTTRDGLAGDRIRCVFESAAGDLWIGTDGAGLNRRTPAGFAHLGTADGLSSNVILSLAEGDGGDLWIGTPDGLNLLHRNGRIELWTTADGLPDDFIRSLLRDADGSLWIGTRHGVAHWVGGRVGGKFVTYASMDGLGSELVGAMARGGGELWVGTSGGLSRRQQDGFARVTYDTVTAIAESTGGGLWLGSNGNGLERLRGGQLQAFPYGAQGLPSTIYSILADKTDRLWLCGQNGIVRVGLAAGGTPAAVTAYGTADGMNIRECSSGGHPAAWKRADGSLWFATLDGVSMIDPAHIPENQTPPPVAIEQVLVDDQTRPLGQNPDQDLVIPPGNHRLEVHYAGLSFPAPQKVTYRYQLEGLDHGWIEAGGRRAAFYTNLSPGHYRFRVLAANNDGVWSPQGASLGFRLLPHFYQTWWFFCVLLLGLGMVSYLVYRWRVLQVETQWSAVLAERGRLAREIHDTLAQGFVGISVQLEVVAQLLRSSRDGALEPLDQARALVRASLADARTSIWDLRSETAADLPARLRQSCDRVSLGSSAKVYLQVKGTYRPVKRTIEDELLRIGQEAVANAVRHAAATRIEVRLVYAAAQVSLLVADDGRGFSPSPGSRGPEGHFGIRGMHERAEEIDAALVIESAPGGGTRVSVEAPL